MLCAPNSYDRVSVCNLPEYTNTRRSAAHARHPAPLKDASRSRGLGERARNRSLLLSYVCHKYILYLYTLNSSTLPAVPATFLSATVLAPVALPLQALVPATTARLRGRIVCEGVLARGGACVFRLGLSYICACYFACQ